jgi:guanylate kinase
LASSTVRPIRPVVVITGTSGAGKGTLVKGLLERVPELRLAVSATTRKQRPGEEDGVHYWFISDEEFDRRLEAGEFVEYNAFPWGQRSGTLWSEIERTGGQGHVALLELETNGALAVERRMPEAVSIFITAPTFEELERRLRERATESSGEIGERLELARRQLELAPEFDHVIVNDELDRALGELTAIVERELATAGTMAP